MMTEDQILALLFAIENGDVTLKPQQDPQEHYAGNITYKTSNGWSLTIFNDCNTWDYIDEITNPDGETLGFDAIAEMPKAYAYYPSDEMALKRYGTGFADA